MTLRGKNNKILLENEAKKPYFPWVRVLKKEWSGFIQIARATGTHGAVGRLAKRT